MPGRFDLRVGDNVDKWIVREPLGSGGNAEVWRASSPAGEQVALKILRHRKRDIEPYLRFRDEVEAMMRIGVRPGVLPLLAHSLPERPTRENRAWIATPIAVPIRSALREDTGLRQVVEAVASIAETLATLAEDHGLYHRDVKPENLYSLDGSWCIGDFGLVTFPDKDSITVAGRLIGPLYYLAPELLLGGAVAPGPTDVYALAETLWVLATGQTYPLPGHLDPDVRQSQLSSFTLDEGTRSLDMLIGRATLVDPTARPMMADVAAELRAWLSPALTGRTDYLPRATLDRVAPRVSARLSAIVERDRSQKYVLERLEEITVALRPLGDSVAKGTGLQPEYGAWSMFTDAREVRALLPVEGVWYQRHAAFHVTMPDMPGASNVRVSLVSGISVTITEDGVAHVFGAHVVYRGQTVITAILTDAVAAPMESAREHRAVEEALATLSSTLGSAVEAFADALS